jgi:hypothetical protein
MVAEWTDVKNLLVGRSLSVQYTVIGSNYWIKAIDGAFEIECILPTDTTLSADSLDFVTNYKTNGNKAMVVDSSVQNSPPYGSKTVIISGVTHKLYARNTGVQFTVAAGVNTLTYTCTYSWAKLIGVEAINCEALDTVDFKVYDTAAGTYSGVPNAMLQQFSYAVNLPKDFYQRMSEFDADVYAGMVIQMIYNSQSAKNIGINFLLDQVV